MAPLFDMESVAPPTSKPAKTSGGGRCKNAGLGQATVSAPTPVAYWIRGVFRFGDGEQRTRTVDGVGKRTQLAVDAARFVAYLRESGWLFPEGRAMLVDVLGIAAHDGGLIILGGERESVATLDGPDD